MPQSANLNPQKHSQQIQAFYKELANLKNANLIKLSNEQKNSIKSHHENILNSYANEFSIDATNSTKQLSLGMKIASFFGAALFFIFLKFWGAPWCFYTNCAFNKYASPFCCSNYEVGSKR